MSTATTPHGAIERAMSGSSDVLLLGESAGRWGASTALLATFGPDRVRDLPISDRANIGLAVGLALGGKKPVVELTGTHRLAAAAEPLVECARMARNGFPCTLVIRVPTGGEAGPVLDTPIGDLALPGVTMVCASSESGCASLLSQALDRNGVTVVFEPRAMATDGIEPSGTNATTVRAGTHMTLVSWGPGLPAAVEAAEQLASDGLDAEIIDLSSVGELDVQSLGAAVRRTGRLIVVHPQDPRLADRVVQAVVESAFLYLEAPPARATTTREAVQAAREAATW